MQSRALVAIAALGLAVGCKAKAEAETGATASAEATGAASAEATGTANVQARMGGTVIAAGDYAVEVLLHAGGAVEALVMDAKGQLVANPGDLKLSLNAAAKGGAQAKIDMKWDPVRACFVGQAGAGVELVPGSVDVSLDLAGKVSAGHLANVSLAVDATHGGQVVMVGDYSVELVADGGFVKAFVVDASGKAHAAGDLDLKLDIGGKAVALAWDAASLCYKAKLDAGVSLDAKPITVKLAAGGKAFVGAVAAYKVDLDAKAKLAAAANLGADAKAKLGASVNVKAPDVKAQLSAAEKAAADLKASVKVPAPKVSVGASAGATAKAGTTATAKAGTGAKAGGGFSIGTK
jgi:hypothetical protein